MYILPILIFIAGGGPSVADVTDFEKAPLGFGQNYTDPKKVTPVSTVKVNTFCFIFYIYTIKVIHNFVYEMVIINFY